MMVSGIQNIERVLIVSQSETVSRALALGLRSRRRGWMTRSAASTKEAIVQVDADGFDTVVVDLCSGTVEDALRCLRTLQVRHPDVRRVCVVNERTRHLPEVLAADAQVPLRSDAERLCRAVEAPTPSGAHLALA